MSTTTTTTTITTVATPTAIPTKTITPSHYKTLNLPPPPTASPSDIRTAFHHFCKLARQPGGPNHIPSFTSSQRFKDLREAYDTLSDPESKKKYDISLAKEGDSEMGDKLGRELLKTKGEKGKGVVRNVNVRGEEVFEGLGKEEVVKWMGRPRGPRVRGTNV